MCNLSKENELKLFGTLPSLKMDKTMSCKIINHHSYYIHVSVKLVFLPMLK